MFEINDERAYITEIQRLLRRIGYDVKPDGIYGEQTRRAVYDFQRNEYLTATGRVDLGTYQALVTAASDISIYEPVFIIPPTLSGSVIRAGERSNVVSIIQAMLRELEVIYPFEVAINGIFDNATVSAVKALQQNFGLTENGIIDADTWNALVTEYEKYNRE